MIYESGQPDLGGDISPRGNFRSKSTVLMKLTPKRPATPDSTIKTFSSFGESERAKQARAAGRKGGRKRKAKGLPGIDW